MDKPAQRRFWEILEERARRMELLSATLQGDGLPPDRAARVLRVELRGLEREAEAADLEPLAALARCTREVLERVGHLPRSAPGKDILILDDSEITRDLLALAIEAEGHSVRVAATLAEFVARFREHNPSVILTEAHIPGAPVDQLCSHLRKLVKDEVIPIVMFSQLSGDALATAALNAGADRHVSKDQGIDELLSELDGVFAEILW